MSGWHRAVCNCCQDVVTEQCGINNVSNEPAGLAAFCSSPTESACPATYTIAFTIPAFNVWHCCSPDPILFMARPAITSVFTISQVSFDNCVYSGQSTTGVDVGYHGCSGQTGDLTVSRWVAASVSSSVSDIYTSQLYLEAIRTPCGSAGSDSPESAGKCCGVVCVITDTINGYYQGQFANFKQSWAYAYKTSTIDNCSAECPCIGHYVSGQGHFQNTWFALSCPEQSIPSHFDITIS